MFVAKEQTFKKVHRIPKMQQIPLTVPHLWTAPELIKAAVDQTGLLPQRTADIYRYILFFFVRLISVPGILKKAWYSSLKELSELIVFTRTFINFA